MKQSPKSLILHSFLPAFLLAFFFLPLNAYNQNEPQHSKPNGFYFDPDRLVYGGNLGFQFGTTTVLDISPLIGYKITDRFVAGLGITYQYFEDRTYSQTFSTNVYGGRVFGRYYVLDNLFAHVEYELLNYDAGFADPFINSFNERRITAHNFYVGAGYVFPVSDNAGFNIMVLYNLNENAESLYSNPLFRLGFIVGI